MTKQSGTLSPERTHSRKAGCCESELGRVLYNWSSGDWGGWGGGGGDGDATRPALTQHSAASPPLPPTPTRHHSQHSLTSVGAAVFRRETASLLGSDACAAAHAHAHLTKLVTCAKNNALFLEE